MTGLDLGEVEDMVDERQQMFCAREYFAQVVVLTGRKCVLAALHDQFGKADDGIHRRAQLVTHGGQKATFRFTGELGLLARLFEFLGLRFTR